MNIYTFCQHYYMLTNLPLQLFDHNYTLRYIIPSIQWNLMPQTNSFPDIYYAPNIYYCSSAFGAYYGLINITFDNSHLVLGPIRESAYDITDFHCLHITLNIPLSLRKQSEDFFQAIPKGNLQQLLYHLNFINYVLNDEEVADSLEPGKEERSPSELRFEEEENLYWKDTSVSDAFNYSLGRQMQEFIRQGDYEGLKKFMSQSKKSHMGKVANSELRQAKNIFIYSNSLALQASIEGGLPPVEAYSISDLYSQQMERLGDIAEVMELNQKVRLEYAYRVSQYKYSDGNNQLIKRIINYIRSHTDQAITTDDIAKYVGYSRPYISSLFKKELGFGLKKFILRTKLERSRILLMYSSKSINEISTFLCFSSQSHFQKAFREQYGETPQYYRKNGFNELRKSK